MDNLKSVIANLFNKPWAISLDKLQEMAAIVEMKVSGKDVSLESVEAANGNDSVERAGAIGVLSISGVLSPHSSMFMRWFGGTGLDDLTKRFQALVDDNGVGAIILNINSPGGSVEGLPEFAETVFNARKSKKIVAIANTMAASAAYWIGTAADEFVALKSSWVGSIGVFTIHHEFSKMLEEEGIATNIISAGKFKTEGNDLEPLTEDAKVHMQEWVDHFYNMFVADVARNRGVTVDAVKEGFGEGRVLPAELAMKESMIDGIETLDQLIARLSIPKAQNSRSRAEAEAKDRERRISSM